MTTDALKSITTVCHTKQVTQARIKASLLGQIYSSNMHSLVAKLDSITEAAILITIYLSATIVYMATPPSWLPNISPLSGLLLQVY